MTFEYGIALHRKLDDPHRTGMTGEEAQQWVAEWVDDGGHPDTFSVIRRPIGDWEPLAVDAAADITVCEGKRTWSL